MQTGCKGKETQYDEMRFQKFLQVMQYFFFKCKNRTPTKLIKEIKKYDTRMKMVNLEENEK